MTTLTEDKVSEYIKKDGYFCPFCGSQSLTAGRFVVAVGLLPVNCENCGKSWRDGYELVGIIYDNEPFYPHSDAVKALILLVERHELKMLTSEEWDNARRTLRKLGVSIDENE